MTSTATISENIANDPTGMLTLHRAYPVLLLLFVALILTQFAYKIGNITAPDADVTTLPSSFGPRVMTQSEFTDPKQLAFDDATSQALALDSYTDRVYVNRLTGQAIVMLVEYRKLGRGAFNHRPEACYPAAGYVLTGRRVTSIVYGGKPAQAVTSVADLNGPSGRYHQVLLYWFASGYHVQANFFIQQVQMALGRLQPEKNGWAFVRLVDECQPNQNAAALAAEKDFTERVSPYLIKCMTTPVSVKAPH